MTARFFRQGFLCWLALGGALIANLTAAAEDKAAAEDEVVLHFPQDPAIGQLAARPAGAGTEEDPKWTIIGQAKGEVRVKKGTEILLQVADAEVLEVLADPDICHFGMTNVRGKVDPATLAQMQSVFLHTLVMSNLKLSDDELKHLQNLRTVRVLDLSMNPIVGPGLKYLSAMKDLEQLSIAYTQVDDDALEHLKGLQKLRKVDFSGSRISEKGYAYLGELPALEEVFIQSMDVGDEAMAGLAKSRSLKKITVANTQVTDKGFADLARIQTLGEVMVISDKMTNKGAADLAGAPHLKSLALICNGVTDDLSVSLKKMRSLKSLTLYCNSLTDKIFADIKEFKDLENFGINAAMISDDGVLSAGEFLAGLKGVGLGSEHITDASLPVFKGARKLEWLDMANTQVSIEGLQDLKKSLPEKCQIRYPMRMQGWKPPVSKAQIEKDSKIFPARTLHFPSDHSVGFVFVRAASSEDPIGHERSDAKGEVEVKGGYKATLNFYGQPEDVEIIFGLKSGDIQELSLGKEFKAYDRLPELKDLKLEKLSLSESRIRDEDVAAISKLDTLTQVSLYGCRVGDACLPYLRPLSRLKELHLSETRVTDSGVAQLAESKLETLWLDGTEITDASVEPLSKISTLKELWIGSTGITQEGADKLRKLLPKCKISYHPRETGPSHAFVTK
ncbi:hypothetical protein HY256_03845, partial [Candidatus Sumerlaeota bacterium]|nr:hypothetical protein [Candidatus Sumerlaeota bacterium]